MSLTHAYAILKAAGYPAESYKWKRGAVCIAWAYRLQRSGSLKRGEGEVPEKK